MARNSACRTDAGARTGHRALARRARPPPARRLAPLPRRRRKPPPPPRTAGGAGTGRSATPTRRSRWSNTPPTPARIARISTPTSSRTLKTELHRHRQGALHLPRGLFRPLRPVGRDGGPLRRRDALFRHLRHAVRQADRNGPASMIRRWWSSNLKKIGRTAGLDDATLDACLNDRPSGEAWSRTSRPTSTADGIEGTPTLIINGEKHSNMTYDDLKAILDAEAGAADHDRAAGGHPRHRTGADSGRPLGRPDPGRSGRRGDQGRGPGRRRHPPLGPALHRA